MSKYIIICLLALSGCSTKPHYVQPLNSQKIMVCKLTKDDMETKVVKAPDTFTGNVNVYSLFSVITFISNEEIHNDAGTLKDCEPSRDGQHYQMTLGG